jgi:hypothetical protein
MTEQQMLETVQYVRERLGTADVAVILGSGLGDFVHVMQNTTELSYKDIPNMPTTTVVGHAGKLISGDIKGVKVFCFAGRFHSYEGLYFTTKILTYFRNPLGGCMLPSANDGVTWLSIIYCHQCNRRFVRWHAPWLFVPFRQSFQINGTR